MPAPGLLTADELRRGAVLGQLGGAVLGQLAAWLDQQVIELGHAA